MEERLIDKDELRGVKKKRTQGEEDAVDVLSSDAAAEEDAQADYTLEFDGEYDEGLVGLTPSQLREELERREHLRAEAHAESEKRLAAGEEKFAAGQFAEAAEAFREALGYEFSETAEERLFAAVTRNYTDAEPLVQRENAEPFAEAEPANRERVLAVFGDGLRAQRREAEERAQPLRERVTAAQEARRAPFAANRAYYLVRFLISLAALVLFAVGIAVSASYLLRVQNPVPTALTITFSVLTFAAFVCFVLFSRKLLVAVRLCRENERLSSTEEGAALAQLEERLDCLSLVLDGAQREPSPAEAE